MIKDNIRPIFHKYFALLDFYRDMEHLTEGDHRKERYVMMLQDYGDCSLKDLMVQRRLMKDHWPPQALAHIFKQLVHCHVLLKAAPLCIYHRDIKPGNIVFNKSSLCFMIIDFGESE